MDCFKCKAEIDADSWYCDQCGTELKVCSSCHKTGKGKICTQCRGKMVSARELAESRQDTELTPPPHAHTEPAPESHTTQVKPDNFEGKTIRPETPPAPEQKPNTAGGKTLILSNNTIKARFQGLDGAIIGRRAGAYVHIFGQHGQVSGSHARLDYNEQSQTWTVTDLGSTNGTKYNGQAIQANIPVKLEHNGRLQIANIELAIENQ